jgi:hypothetical protein
MIKTYENFSENLQDIKTDNWYPYSFRFKDSLDNKIYKVTKINFLDEDLEGFHRNFKERSGNIIHVNFIDVDIFPETECECDTCIERKAKRYNL